MQKIPSCRAISNVFYTMNDRKAKIWIFYPINESFACKQKLKSFIIQKKHFNKLILYIWRFVQLVIYNIFRKLNLTKN